MDSKNVFILVLAHLEPELELFEVDDIGDDGDDDFICLELSCDQPNGLIFSTFVSYSEEILPVGF